MPEETLILKRDPDAVQSEHYDVLFEGRYVGRIYKAVSHAPREAPWFWGLDFFEWQGSDGPQYGNVATLEAAKQTFRAGIVDPHIKTRPLKLGGLAVSHLQIRETGNSGDGGLPLSIVTNLKGREPRAL